MRVISLATRRALYAQETDEVLLCLLTISGAGLATPLRFVNNTEDVVSRGSTYLAYPFQIPLPDERDDQTPQVMLIIDNIDQNIVAAVRALTEQPAITLEIVVASQADTVEAGPFAFSLKSVEYDSISVSGTLAFEDVLNEIYPADSFDPTRFPGLYQGVAGNTIPQAA